MADTVDWRYLKSIMYWAPAFRAAMSQNLKLDPQRRGPNNHINRRVLQTMMSSIPLLLDLKKECGILMFVWYYTKLYSTILY